MPKPRLQPGQHPQRIAGSAGRRQHTVQVGGPRGGEQPTPRRGRPDERLDRSLRRARHREPAQAGEHQPEPQPLDAQQSPGGRAIAAREVAAAVQQDTRDDGGRCGQRPAPGQGRRRAVDAAAQSSRPPRGAPTGGERQSPRRRQTYRARPPTTSRSSTCCRPRQSGASRPRRTGANLGPLHVVSGNTTGLKPSQKHALERVYRRRLRPAEVASAELAAYLCEISREIERQVGILVGRRGEIEHVFVGDASRINLPEIGRIRAGRGRFRGLRLVHTHLRNEPLTRDDLVDLALLRLDLVAAIGVWPDGRPADLHVAHLLPPVEGGAARGACCRPSRSSAARWMPAALIEALEEEFERVAPAVIATDKRDRALLVVVDIRRPSRIAGAPRPLPTSSESRVNELRELCRTAGVRVMGVLEQRRPERRSQDLIGRGKLEEVLIRAMQLDANVLIFDPDLTPVQAHAIADFTDLKVIDRTMLILDIFAQRAKSRDGKLQVELAQLRYRLPRLHEKNTMMSRLTGGIGGRGPGETKLEENRRRARERIHRLEKEIDRFGEQRAGRRAERARRGLPIVAIVGYTNAGKSTLLNTLTRSDVLAEDRLFATLDPTTRRLRLPREREIIIADTVGFIRDLPRDLARAFRATLEELDEADLLLHVVDAADPAHEQQIAAVEAILADLGLAETRADPGDEQDRPLAPGGSREGARARIGTAISRWWPCPRRTARRRRRCWRRSRRRWPARGSRTSRRPAIPTARACRHEASRVSFAREPDRRRRGRVVLLGVLILVHELGHFVFAKLFHVKVLRFSLGFGPRICRHHLRRDRIPAVGDPAGRVRAPAGRGPRRSDPAHRPAARAGGEAAVATLHRRRRRAGVQPAAARCSSTSSTSPASARCCRRSSGRCCPTCPRRRRACCPAIGSRASTATASATGRSWRTRSRGRPARRCASRSGAGPTWRSATSRRSRSSGRARCGASSAWG